MQKPLISVITTTKNSGEFLEECLKSINEQTYKKIESIVVDNNSDDRTKEIARKYTKFVYNKGPERSAQRNYGAKKAKGEYLLFIDSDMVLSPKVVEECVNKIKDRGGLIIPEESFGEGFWAECKKLERSFYIGNDSIEGARFFPKKIFEKVKGFDENITGPEDWDLSQRIKNIYGLSRIKSKILHNEGNLSLIRTIKKKYYYSQKFGVYLNKTDNNKYTSQQFSIIERYLIFLRQPMKLFQDPVIGIGMLFMKTCEFIAGGIGYLGSRNK